MSRCQFCDHRNAAGRTRCEKCGAELPVEAATEAATAARRELTGLDAEIATLIEREGLIPAIKRYREATGQGLKESKEAVEALARRAGITRAAGTGTGCATMIVAAIATVYLAGSGIVGGLWP